MQFKRELYIELHSSYRLTTILILTRKQQTGFSFFSFPSPFKTFIDINSVENGVYYLSWSGREREAAFLATYFYLSLFLHLFIYLVFFSYTSYRTSQRDSKGKINIKRITTAADFIVVILSSAILADCLIKTSEQIAYLPILSTISYLN